MPDKPLIAVVGATGAQGGGLVRAILDDPPQRFRVRAITRNPSSEKARALSARGAEVVAADIGDESSVARAFAGAAGAFCVTFYWDHLSPERELREAQGLARAAKQAGVPHVVWSTLEDTRQWVPLADTRMPTLLEHYKVPHFDAKGEADATFVELGVPTTFLRTSFYWDNFISFGAGPKRGPDGVLALTMPMGDRKLPGIAAEDIGRCALGVFARPADFTGRTIGIVGQNLTGAEMAASLTRALGQQVRYNDVPPEVYRGFGFPGADDLGNMFQFKRDFNEMYCGHRSIELSRTLNPALQTFDTWLDKNAKGIPIE
jgi:uncharacterized protein YbjT (DUF2867 family)